MQVEGDAQFKLEHERSLEERSAFKNDEQV